MPISEHILFLSFTLKIFESKEVLIPKNMMCLDTSLELHAFKQFAFKKKKRKKKKEDYSKLLELMRILIFKQKNDPN